MKTKLTTLLVLCALYYFAGGQVIMSDSLHHVRDSSIRAKDSAYRAMFQADSGKIEKEFADKAKWEKVEAKSIYPLLKGNKNSGVVPVKDANEISNPNIDYKILFELTGNNPDSTAKDINAVLTKLQE
jgi:hypothetical protein